MEQMADVSGAATTKKLAVVVPGDFIESAAGLTAGHGTFEALDEEDDENENP